jgi:magnesium transporter
MLRINRFIHKRGKSVGLPPGTPTYGGERKEEDIQITVLDYDEGRFNETDVPEIEECLRYKDSGTTTWINVDGIHDADLIADFGRLFEIHPLALEDIVNPWQRPKVEDYDRFLYVVIRMLSYDDERKEVLGEQVSLILTDHCVFSFQERPGDIFEGLRERIRKGKGRIRRMGADYLLYALLDTLVDQYFLILEKLGERIEELENEVITSPVPESVKNIHRLKREMIYLRKAVWPLRELLNTLERGESRLVTEATQRYLRDVYDHAFQVIDTVETFRDMLSGMHDTYLSSLSNRMNEVMKVLTIIATIFIPLTFIAGIYGMNFEVMPELRWPWGYAGVLLLMLMVGIGMVVYFKRKRWL